MVFVIFMNAHRCYNKQCTTWNIIWGGINTKCDTVINPAKQTLQIGFPRSLVDRPIQLFYIWIFICCKYTTLKTQQGNLQPDHRQTCENWCRMSCFLISHQMLINIQHKHLWSGVRQELRVLIESLLITIPAAPPCPTLKKSSKMGAGQNKLWGFLHGWLYSELFPPKLQYSGYM